MKIISVLALRAADLAALNNTAVESATVQKSAESKTVKITS